MRVKATAPGFYGCLRDVGEEFDISGEQDLGSWMQVGDKPKPEARAKPGPKPAAKPEEKPEDNLPDA
ncbi:MAG: hypothetical protein ACLGIW_03265 [Gammaproteobacteria bacterium]